jgi:hypothetical protein
MSIVDFDLNRRGDLMGPEFFSPNRIAENHLDTGVHAYWPCWGTTPGLLEMSMLRLELEPGAHTTLNNLPGPGFFFLSNGEGRVAGLQNQMKNGIVFDGSTPQEAGWLSDQLIIQGVPVVNTSKDEKLVLTIDFQQEVHFD